MVLKRDLFGVLAWTSRWTVSLFSELSARTANMAYRTTHSLVIMLACVFSCLEILSKTQQDATLISCFLNIIIM
jgi:hypothetical protein